MAGVFVQEIPCHSVPNFYLFFWCVNAVAEFLCAQPSFLSLHSPIPCGKPWINVLRCNFARLFFWKGPEGPPPFQRVSVWHFLKWGIFKVFQIRHLKWPVVSGKSELCMSLRGKVSSCCSQLTLLGGCGFCKDKAYSESELRRFWARCLAGRDARRSFLVCRLNREALKSWLWYDKEHANDQMTLEVAFLPCLSPAFQSYFTWHGCGPGAF